MARHLLDADTCIYYLKNLGDVRERVERHGGLRAMAISTPTMAELYDGAYYQRRVNPKGSEFADVQRLIARVRIEPFDTEAAQRFGAVRSHLPNFDAQDNFDLANACIALVKGYTLVTHNPKDYRRVPGLKAVDWVSPAPALPRKLRDWLKRRRSGPDT